jgi:hypothetical protein
MPRISLTSPLVIGLATLVIGTGVFLVVHKIHADHARALATITAQESVATPQTTAPAVVQPVAAHLATPPVVKALYMTSWIASSPKLRQHILDLVNTTEVNAVVLDIKDETGHPSFTISDPVVADTIQEMHAKNIYVIGRIVVFKDGYLTKTQPDWALTKKSDGTPWHDPKGSVYLDPANQHVWDYTTALAIDAYNTGFDEINFDYIRYPSDGNLKDLNYNLQPNETRADVLAHFFDYLSTHIKQAGIIPISADVFGQTTTETGDMGIGQVFARDIQYFDFIDPMIYPSHYQHDTYGLKNPTANPYELVIAALKGAKEKIDKVQADPNISAEIKSKTSYSKVRPWLQDFSMNHIIYTPELIDAQMKAEYDSGLTSWLMWDPSNKYTASAYPSSN